MLEASYATFLLLCGFLFPWRIWVCRLLYQGKLHRKNPYLPERLANRLERLADNRTAYRFPHKLCKRLESVRLHSRVSIIHVDQVRELCRLLGEQT